MTKSGKKSASSLPPLPLFEWVKQARRLTSQGQGENHGSLDIDSEFRAAISADIKACPLSRAQIAAKMSDLVGREITLSMLNNWSAKSHERHNFPCQYLPAFVVVTGGRRAFECLSKKSGLFALPGPEALRAEISKLDEQIETLKKERERRKLFLKEISNGEGVERGQ